MKKTDLLNFKRFTKKISLTEIRISIYGFKAESTKIKADFCNFFEKLSNLKVRVFLINFPEACVSDLKSGEQDMDYITIKCGNKKVLIYLKKLLTTDEIFKSHFIDYQQVVFLTTGASY
jgi:hypothetical protein